MRSLGLSVHMPSYQLLSKMHNHLQAWDDLVWLQGLRLCCLSANHSAQMLPWIRTRPLKYIYHAIGSLCAGTPVICRDGKAGAGYDAVAGGSHRRCSWRNWRRLLLLLLVLVLLLPLLVRAKF